MDPGTDGKIAKASCDTRAVTGGQFWMCWYGEIQRTWLFPPEDVTHDISADGDIYHRSLLIADYRSVYPLP